MNPCSVDIKEILIGDSALGLSFGDNLNVGREMPSPDNLVTIIDTGGSEPAQSTDMNNEVYRYDRIQIVVRNKSYQNAWALVNAIFELLHGYSHTIINDTYYSLIKAMQTPFIRDWDENDRINLVINFEIQRR